MNSFTNKWLRIAFFNLLILSVLGVILRYKIAFSLPFVDQKNLLHGHSHFAFSGWITQALMYLLIRQLKHDEQYIIVKKYKWILWGNLLTAFGMLFSFPVEGYGLFSIIFSTISIFVSYWFAVVFWKDMNKQSILLSSHKWFKAAVFFNALSSIGAFTLAYIMVEKIMIQKLSLLSVYFFLHFQYNGWFFFACLGLLISVTEQFITDKQLLNNIFLSFFFACFPAYFLSALWLTLPTVIFLMVITSALIQIIAWSFLVYIIWIQRTTFTHISSFSKNLFKLSALALSLKLLLQLISIIPSLSQLAFGFRPIVIGYLHLVLLGVITISILSYVMINEIKNINTVFKKGIIIFVAGIIINEVLLMMQGVSDLAYIGLPFINELLFTAALILFSGLLILNLGLIPKKYLQR